MFLPQFKVMETLLDFVEIVGLPGFEPRKTAPKTVVLPLHHSPLIPAGTLL